MTERGQEARGRVINDLRQMIRDAEHEAEFELNGGSVHERRYWHENVAWLRIALAAVQAQKTLPKKGRKR